jgi:hypothetical protein
LGARAEKLPSPIAAVQFGTNRPYADAQYFDRFRIEADMRQGLMSTRPNTFVN